MKNTPPLSFSQELIDDALCRGSNFVDGKFRIFEQFEKQETPSQNAAFLKKEYGIGGYSGPNEPSVSFNGKGMEIADADREKKYNLTWKEVAARIGQLIAANRYFTPLETEAYFKYKNSEKKSEIADYSDKALHYSVGDNVFIGAKEYEILSVGDTVALSDISFPLYHKEYAKSDFEEKLRENPLNSHLTAAQDKTGNEVSADYEDAFFVNKNRESVTWIYYNPDSTAGGQYVFNEVTFEQILEAASADDFFGYLGSFAEQTSADIKTESFAPAEEQFLSVPDFTDCTEETKSELIKTALKELEPIDKSKRYQVITDSRNDGGIDEKLEYATLEEAQNAAKEYVSDGYDGACVYDKEAELIDNVYGDFRVDIAFSDDILVKNGIAVPIDNEISEVLPVDKLDKLPVSAVEDGKVVTYPNAEAAIENEVAAPYFVCEWSEHPAFEAGKRYAVSEFDRLMKDADDEWLRLQKEEIEKYKDTDGIFKAYDSGEITSYHIGYAKTKFNLHMPDGKVYTERQDIGDGDGGVIDFLSQYEPYKDIVPILREIVAKKSPQSPQKTYKTEAVYTAEENNTPYDIVIQSVRTEERQNYHITDNDLGVGGPKERYGNNIEAIKTLQAVEAENRLATPDEQEILAKYVGWGGLQEAFDETKANWSNEYNELRTLLSDKEYEAARASVMTAFYTPPVVIKAIYKALANMGFEKGNICDPACGIGHFIGMLPETMSDSRFFGVELDSISGRIAKQLYQKADIAVQGFEQTTIPDSFLDVMVGNVPFGDIKVYDEKYNRHNFLIHDYFFAKALDKVRPGGVIAFITSKGTMDKANPAVRKYIAERAELLGAIRLPDNVFKGAAGTEVTSDILFLQKRSEAVIADPEWVYLDTTPNGVTMNSYFVTHPEMIVGKIELVKNRFGKDEAVCKADESTPFEAQLNTAVERINAQITEYELTAPEAEQSNTTVIPASPDVRNFAFAIVNGEVYYRENAVMELSKCSATAKERMKGLIAIRDCTRQLLEYQTDDRPETDIADKRNELNSLYDGFVDKYGRLTSRTNKSLFQRDGSAQLVFSLENLDEDGKFLNKADIFTKRTIKAHKAVEHVDTAEDALTVSLGEKAKIDFEYMRQLTGKTDNELISDLNGVIFRDITADPAQISKESVDINSFPFVTADEYLSGNVRRKLHTAKAVYEALPDEQKPLVESNITALTAVQPKDLTAAEISVHLGATWIPEDIYTEFMHNLFETPLYSRFSMRVVYNKYVNEWKISNRSYDSMNIKAYSTYGTRRANGYRILEDTLNLRDTQIFDTVTGDDGKQKSVLNSKETAIAQGKQDLIKQTFAQWIWKDPERRRMLCKLYNEKFNSVRPREYNGKNIIYHGMNPNIQMRPHQNDAVAHILYGGNTLLAHTVGAGKTFEMTAAAMELKRLGLRSKSMIVVPNHLTEQWAAEFLLLYPSANLLVTRKEDFRKENRRRFCSKIATGDFDAVIIGQSQFEKIPVSIERQEKMIRRQITELSDGIASVSRESGQHISVKSMERSKRSLEERLKRLTEQSDKDDVVTFEQLGVDMLFIDEAHFYKNLYLVTKMRNVAGISQSEAKKSTDLFMKCQYLDEITGGKGVVFATGTPISNSMTELYTMQRYLQYDALSEMGIESFDSWASAFGETTTAMELAPEGTGYRFKKRFSRFNNLPELMSLFKETADIKTPDLLNLAVPQADYHNVVTSPSDFQRRYISGLAERSEKIHRAAVSPYEDNMLKITNEGRKLALDERLIDPFVMSAAETKTEKCAENVFNIWSNTSADKSAQLVFCDLSTPKGGSEFSVYDELKRILIEKGIPENEIAFIHDANTDVQKKNLFAKVRSGSVRVLVGSTAKMGAGTNVQDRLVALHHLDCPWRPSDLQQREGRIIRQGNKNAKVDIYRYITESTFDSYMWQLVESKQKFISQIMTSRSPVRSAEDVDETTLSYAEVKALASGNPMIMEKCQLEAEVGKLNLQKASFLNQKYDLEDKIAQYYPKEIQRLKVLIKNIAADIDTVDKHPAPEDGISPMNINGKVFTERAKAGTQLLLLYKGMKVNTEIPVGTYRGFGLTLAYDGIHFDLKLKGNATYTVQLGTDASGNIQRIDNAINGISKSLDENKQCLELMQTQLETAKKEVENDFEKESELAEKSERLAKINALLTVDDSPIKADAPCK